MPVALRRIRVCSGSPEWDDHRRIPQRAVRGSPPIRATVSKQPSNPIMSYAFTDCRQIEELMTWEDSPAAPMIRVWHTAEAMLSGAPADETYSPDGTPLIW